MTLHEIDKAIIECIDEETGEVDVERLTELQLERDAKVKSVAEWVIELQGDIVKLKYEEDRIAAIKKQTSNRIDALKKWLCYALGNESYKGDTFKVNVRRNESVELDPDLDHDELPDEFVVTTIDEKADKNKIKKAIKEGVVIPGVKIVESYSASVK